MEFLSQESNTTIDWLLSNHIIVNPKKFQTIVTTQRNLQNNPASLSINNKNSVELLGVNIDNKLAFETHINKLCRSASCQLNAIIRLESFSRFQAKKVLIESLVYSNFTKHSGHFCKAKLLQKIKNIKKRALQYLHDDFEGGNCDLFQKSNKTTMRTEDLGRYVPKFKKH